MPAAVGAAPGELLAFEAESDGQVYDVPQHDLASLLAETGLDRADLVLADVQGAETVLLERARGDLEAGRVRFSSSPPTTTASPATRSPTRTPSGSCWTPARTSSPSTPSANPSAATASSRCRSTRATRTSPSPVTHARYRDSFAGEVEYDLAAAVRDADRLRAELARTAAERDEYQAELEAVFATKL
ncbi:hypothetical protein [Amycolatopsis sp. lyj-109]|uniref:hypothetical protein n=1 Tax=Amycolatopsis sp. lyj-109 TaxID=2789287 RepID=UPI00397C7AC5